MLHIALELSNGFDMNSVKLIIAALALVVLDVQRVDSRLHDGGNNNNYKQRMETLTSKLISSNRFKTRNTIPGLTRSRLKILSGPDPKNNFFRVFLFTNSEM